MERLHKFLARAGVDSRRACEELMLAGRVAVNGRVQRELGTQIDPDVDDIQVDGEPIKAPTELHYVILHKPRSVITSMSDPEGRPTVADLVKTDNRLFPVGRLDFDSEGLLLLTDDGDLAYKLTHPSFQVEKEYHALFTQAPNLEQLRQWREGVDLDDGRTVPAWIETLEETIDGTWVRIVIHEGRNRQVRRVAEALGLEVKRLVRLREGPLLLQDLAAGQWRPLTTGEISNLRLHAKQSRAWLPARPMPESPQDENPQERPRMQMQRIDRSGQSNRRREEVGEPRDDQRGQRSLGGTRPLRRRSETLSLEELKQEARSQSAEFESEVAAAAEAALNEPTTEERPLRRRDEQPRDNETPRGTLKRDENRGEFRRDDRPRRDEGRPPFQRDERPRDDRPRDDRPRRDDGRPPFQRDDRPRDDRPRRDDGRPPFQRDERPRDERPRRDEGRPPFQRDERPRDDRSAQRDEQPRRNETRTERPVRRRSEVTADGSVRPWEQSQEAAGSHPAERPPDAAPRPEPTREVVAPPAPRVEPAPQPTEPRERTKPAESSTGMRRPWTRMGGRGIVGRSHTAADRKPKGDDNE